MRYFFLAYLLVIVLVVGIAGFRGEKFTHTPLEVFPDMDHQLKTKPQLTNEFFADGTAQRKPVAGTVPMGLHPAERSAADGGYEAYGFSHGSDYYNSGHLGDFYGDGFPEQITVNAELLHLGRERYDINCAICHGESGDGKGRMSKFGFTTIADFQTPPFFDPKDPAYRANGKMFEVITKGQGLMGSYGANIPVRERWAIIAWVRTLQLSRKAPLSDPGLKEAWEQVKPATPAAPATPPAPLASAAP